MKDLFKKYLFDKHMLVTPNGGTVLTENSGGEAFAVVVALAKKFSIRITHGAEHACKELIEDASKYLGENIPLPFYRGFPYSVRELTTEQRYYDQMYHYTQTYGMGWFKEPGHSMVEQLYTRIGFNEYSEPTDFIILTEIEAEEKIKEYSKSLLAGNRPLNPDQILFVVASYGEFGKDILPDSMPCKDTVVRFLYGTKDLDFCHYLKLSDTIKLLQYIQFSYGSENIKKLNLKNQDRKFLTKVIDWFDKMDMEKGTHKCDYLECFAKRKIWCGLFHHIHYRPKLNQGLMGRFIHDIRNNKNQSHYHYFEMYMRNGNRKAAANYLKTWKGESSLVRNLNYILSRCDSEHEIEEVLKCLE